LSAGIHKASSISEEFTPLVVFAEDKILMAMLMDLMGSHLKDMEKNWLLSKNRNKTEVAHGIGK